jgi:hypothetical protein
VICVFMIIRYKTVKRIFFSKVPNINLFLH